MVTGATVDGLGFCKVKGEFLCGLAFAPLSSAPVECDEEDDEKEAAEDVDSGSLTILGTFIDSLLVRSLASCSSIKSKASLRCELIGVRSSASSR